MTRINKTKCVVVPTTTNKITIIKLLEEINIGLIMPS